MNLVTLFLSGKLNNIEVGTINTVVGSILCFLFGLALIYPLPEKVSAAASLIWILFVPYGIGNIVINCTKYSIKKLSYSITMSGTVDLVVNWFIGLFFIIGTTLLIMEFHIDIIKAIGPGLLVGSTIFWVIKLRRPDHATFQIPLLKIALVLLIIGVSFGLYARSLSPYPLSPGFDLFSHIYTAKNLLNNSLTTIPLVYLPSWDFLIGLGSSTFDGDLLAIFWMGSVFISIIFTFSTYLLTYWLSRSRMLAVFSCIIALSVTEAGLAPNIQFLFPASFVMAIFPATLVVLPRIWNEGKYKFSSSAVLTAIIVGGFLVIHFQLGLFASFFALIYVFAVKGIKRSEFLLYAVRIMSLALACIIFFHYAGLTSIQLQLYTPSGKLFSLDYMFSTKLKIFHLNEWYTPLVIILAFVGMVFNSLSRDYRILAISFLSELTLLIYFQQIQGIHRIMPLERPLIAFSSATALILPIFIILQYYRISFSKLINNIVANFRTREAISFNFTKGYWNTINSRMSAVTIFYFLVITLLLFPTLLVPYDKYFQLYKENGYDLVNFTDEEAQAAKWINMNTPKDHMIYSDPYTVIEMRGLSFRPNVPNIGWNTTVSDIVKNTFTSFNASESYTKMITDVGPKLTIVVTPRTSSWIQGSDQLVQFPVKNLVQFDGFQKFLDSKYFRLLYHSQNIYIFKPVSS